MGIGGTKVTLSVSPQQVPQGGQITGSVLLVGGKVEQKITAVKVQLVKAWYEEEVVELHDDSGADHETRQVTKHEVVQESVVSQAFTIKPEEQKQFPVELTVPLYADLNRDDLWWEVVGVAEIGGGADSREPMKIAVTPSAMMAQFQTIVTQQLQWGLKEIVPDMSPGGVVQMKFSPPAELQQQLDEIRCIMRNNTGQLQITLQLDFQEKKFGDYFKAMVGKDAKAANLNVPEADLQNNQAAVVDSVKQRLQQLTNQSQD